MNCVSGASPRTSAEVPVVSATLDDMDADETVVTGPTGRQFAITISRPVPAADGGRGSPLGGGLVSLLIRVVRAGKQVAASRWQVEVTERRSEGPSAPPIYSFGVGSQREAQAGQTTSLGVSLQGIPSSDPPRSAVRRSAEPASCVACR
jgi:hypothetical protein